MVSIQIDEKTAAALEVQARSAGLSVADYVRNLVPSIEVGHRPSWDEIEQEMLAQSTPAPTLTADFSRADIYTDHD
jgi:hypothetical protein